MTNGIGEEYTSHALASLHFAFATLSCPEVFSFASRQNLPSNAVMKRIGMRCVSGGDFDDPKIEAGHELCRHVLYKKQNPKRSKFCCSE